MTDELFPPQTGVIQFLDSDFLPIKGTEHIWLKKNLKRKAVTGWARYWHRRGLPVEMIGTSDAADIRKVQELFPSLTEKQKRQQYQNAEYARAFKKAAIEFQKILCETEPMPSSIVGTVTIPEDYDTYLVNEDTTT
tara:strand:- start:209 stop:616 length:408 start_codon:yes stop_codon:yes gene_type:complete